MATRKPKRKYKWSSAQATDWSTIVPRIEITDEERREMLEAQGGLCAICRRREPIIKDHCHDSGIIRGLLCRGCNSALGVFGDSEEGLERALEYLRAFKKRMGRLGTGEPKGL